MMSISDTKEIRERALKAIDKELGLVGTIRYLQQLGRNYGNYTEDREEILGNPSIDDIVKEIDDMKKEK